MIAIDVTNTDTDLEEARAIAELINQQETDEELQTKDEFLSIVFDMDLSVDEKMDRLTTFDIDHLNSMTLVEDKEIDSIEEFWPVLHQVEQMHEHPRFDLKGMATIIQYVKFGNGTLEEAVEAQEHMRSIDMDMHISLDGSKLLESV